jgi:16S rRNA pseudouridine516 synthase
MSRPERIRLDRLLSNLGYGSRREVHQMLARGLVSMSGEAVRKPDLHLELVPALRGLLKVRGEELDPLPGLTLIMHKPLGLSCSHDGGGVVYDLLPERWRLRTPPISTVGRLDKNTSGLLLLTDDGELLHRIASPKQALYKRYRAKLDRPLRGNEAEVFGSGTLILNGETKPLLPARFEPLSPNSALVGIAEGRYHQVRRMFAAVGNHVISLHRECVGALELPPDLAEGQFRALSQDELGRVFLP